MTAKESLAELIDLNVAPFLAESLVSEEYLNRIRPLSSLVDASDVFHFGFEVRLDSTEPSADFGICYVVEGGDCRELHALLNRLERDADHEPSVARIQNCVTEWGASPALSGTSIKTWLEFDFIAPERPPLANPSFFFAVPTAFWLPKENAGSPLLWRTLQQLTGAECETKNLHLMHELRGSLPKESGIFELGVLLGRRSHNIRIGIRSIEIGDILPYLAAVGWQGDARYVERMLNYLRHTTTRVDVGLDVYDGCLHETLGLECYFAADDKSNDAKQQWKGFCDFLCGEGMAVSDKVNALGWFAGHVLDGNRISLDHSVHHDERHGDVYELSVYHVKMSVGKTTSKAKAYLSALRLAKDNREQ